MRVQFRGRRLAFTLGSGNKEAAAKIAASIYGELLAQGVEATLARHRVQKPEKPAEVATVGQWIAAAEKVFHGKPSSFVGYARALRLIAAEVAKVKKPKRAMAGAAVNTGERRIQSRFPSSAPRRFKVGGSLTSKIAVGTTRPSNGPRVLLAILSCVWLAPSFPRNPQVYSEFAAARPNPL